MTRDDPGSDVCGVLFSEFWLTLLKGDLSLTGCLRFSANKTKK